MSVFNFLCTEFGLFGQNLWARFFDFSGPSFSNSIFLHISNFFLNENFLDTYLLPKTLFGYISMTKNTFWIHFYFWPNFCSVLKSSFSFLDMLWLEVTSHKQFLINSSYVSSEEINLVFKSIQKNTRFAGVPLDATAEPWRERQTACIHFMFKKQINLTLGVPFWFWIRGYFFWLSTIII